MRPSDCRVMYQLAPRSLLLSSDAELSAVGVRITRLTCMLKRPMLEERVRQALPSACVPPGGKGMLSRFSANELSVLEITTK